jgi:uncharacterized membrane protein
MKNKRRTGVMRFQKRILTFSAYYLFVVLFLLALCSFSYAENQKKNLPARGISVSPEYTAISVATEESVSIDLKIINRGRRDENINIDVTYVPKGWKAWIKTYNFAVKGVHVESDSSKSLTFRAEPDRSLSPGEYVFKITAKTDDRKLVSRSQLLITAEKKEKKKKPGGVNINTSYPVLRGPTDATFEFSMEVENKLDKDSIFNLTAQGPENWEINFKPAYEEKYISSLRLKAGQSQTMAVQVKPHSGAKPDSYPISVKVGSSEANAEAKITLELTGTYKLDSGTPDGLLSLNAVRGEEANLSFYVRNSGSATLNNVEFLSIKPENWKVEFKPEKLDVLMPGELKQIEVTITPSDQALVGDYSVGLSTNAGKINKTIEMRVTVKASTAWGWIGIGIIVLVLAGLVILFIRFGRR